MAAALLVGSATGARAGEWSGRSTTTFRAFDLKQSIVGAPRTVRYRPLDEMLSVSAWDLGQGRAWRVDVAVRGRLDLAGGQRGGDDDFDVLFANAAWASPRDRVGLTLGRQLAVSGFGWHGYDGARFELSHPRRGKLFAFAGLPVSVFANGAPDTDDLTWGAGGAVVFPSRGSLGVEYEVRRFDHVKTEEWAGLDLNLAWARTRVAANADYSALLGRFGETALVVGHELRPRHFLEARFTRVEPVFPADTIWAIFATNPYDEVRASYELRGPRLGLGGYVSREDYMDTDVPGAQGVERAAVTMSFAGGRRSARHRGEIGWQFGFSGSRLALSADSDLDVAARWRAGGGLSIHRYENVYRLTEEDEQVALRGRLTYDHRGRWDLGCEVEQFFGRDRDVLRAMLVFDVKLGQSRRERPWWGGRWGGAWAGGASGATGADDAEDVQ